MGLPCAEKSLMISIQYQNVIDRQTYKWTDGRTDRRTELLHQYRACAINTVSIYSSELTRTLVNRCSSSACSGIGNLAGIAFSFGVRSGWCLGDESVLPILTIWHTTHNFFSF